MSDWNNHKITSKNSQAGQDWKVLLEQKIRSLADNFSATSSDRFARVQTRIRGLDMVRWLHEQADPVKTYWRDREGKFEMAGLGEADTVYGCLLPGYETLFNRLKEYLDDASENIRYYGGLRFNKKDSSDFAWKTFTSYRFIVPRFEIFRDGAETFFACNILFKTGEVVQKLINRIINELDAIRFDTGEIDTAIPSIIQRSDYPDKDDWKKNIELSLQAFADHQLEKIVLARKTIFKFEKNIDPIDLLWRLRLNNHRAYYFCFQPREGIAFLGGTPEQLYLRLDRNIFTEAVAGTRRRGKTEIEDQYLEDDLLNSEKDVREHRFVVDSIRNSLNDLCTSLHEQNKLSVLKLSGLQHLLMQFNGKLALGMEDPHILENLHPTPAVGGVPVEKALPEIERIENFDRGWYAGPVGWVSKDKAEFAVAIRSGLVYEDELQLYSGAGIVAGSDYEKEWEEIENKIAGYTNILEGDFANFVLTDFSKSS